MIKLASSTSLTFVFEKLLAFNIYARAQLIVVLGKIARYHKNPISFKKIMSSVCRALSRHLKTKFGSFGALFNMKSMVFLLKTTK